MACGQRRNRSRLASQQRSRAAHAEPIRKEASSRDSAQCLVKPGQLLRGNRAIGLVGGVFLLWLAWRTLQPRPAAATSERGLPLDPRGAYLSILALTLTNPMTILSFAALFAGLRVTGRDSAGSAFVTAGVFAGSGAWWVLLTSAVAAFRLRITPYWLRAINVVSEVCECRLARSHLIGRVGPLGASA